MPTQKVDKYEATAYYTSTGSSHTKLYAFSEAQAAEIGAVLEEDGIDIVAAQRLCEKWTKRGQHTSIHYTYRIPYRA